MADALNDAAKPLKGSKVALLGMAYKKDVDDPRESPAFELMDLLLKKGAVRDATTIRTSPKLPRMRHWPHLNAMDEHAAHRGVPRRAGLRPDRDRPHRLRLRAGSWRTASS